MNCPTDSTLRAYLDAELDAHELAELKTHLQSCAACQDRCEALSATARQVATQLSSLDGPPSAMEANPQIALARFRANLPSPEPPRLPFFARLFSPSARFAWAASLAAAILLVSLMFPATRGFAQRLLATLRVERVQTVALDFGPANNAASGQPLETLSKMLSENAVVTSNEKEFPVNSQQAATQAAGFPVRVISSRSDTPAFNISGAHAFRLTLDRSRLQDVLDEAGRSDLLLPATLDGATVSVQVPRAVAVEYGACTKENEQSTDIRKPDGREIHMIDPSSGMPNPCLVLIQAPSPIVNVPSDLNIQQLAEIGLQLGGWDPVKARQFTQSVDLKSTLVLPIPRNVQSYETVNINGIRGTLMQFPTNTRNNNHPSFGLIWVDGGIIYSILGQGDSSSAVQLASSLQ
jgi:anti-sigma factor RsiW